MSFSSHTFNSSSSPSASFSSLSLSFTPVIPFVPSFAFYPSFQHSALSTSFTSPHCHHETPEIEKSTDLKTNRLISGQQRLGWKSTTRGSQTTSADTRMALSSHSSRSSIWMSCTRHTHTHTHVLRHMHQH